MSGYSINIFTYQKEEKLISLQEKIKKARFEIGHIAHLVYKINTRQRHHVNQNESYLTFAFATLHVYLEAGPYAKKFNVKN